MKENDDNPLPEEELQDLVANLDLENIRQESFRLYEVSYGLDT